MIKLINLLLEAYEFFPTSEDEIENDAVKQLFSIVKKYPGLKIEDPIGMTGPEALEVKITRDLEKDPNFIKYISSKLKKQINPQSINTWNGVKIKWGYGSRGGRGTKSKGYSSESSITRDLETLKKEGISKINLSQFTHPDLMIEMSKELGLKKGNFEIKSQARENQKRPLVFTPSGPIIDFSNKTVAQTLTDVTINKGSDTYYISVKYGGKTNFFNSGVKKTFPVSEIKSGKITNPNGVAFLETFGINNKLFCQVFNDYGKAEFSKFNKNPESTKYDVEKIKRLIESGIGNGYYMAHVGSGNDQFFKVDKKYAKTASDVTSPKIYYGGKKGGGKRIDIEFESPLYAFNLNIRNSGAGIYPGHLLCTYTKK